MAKKTTGDGLMSSAGLMRYYDADKKAVHIEPKTVVAFGIIAGIAILFLNASFGLWP